MTARRVLVTGGGGFLGRAIVERLLARGDIVRIFSRGDYPDLRARGVKVIQGDLACQPDVINACSECDVIIHSAAQAGVWGPYRDYYLTNCLGTANVLAAQRIQHVPKLVYTSSPSVVFDGADMAGVDESAAYARTFKAAYPRTKAMAEQGVLASSDKDFATMALRPHLIWGPGDNHLVPRIISRARQLRRIGKLDPLIDCIYIDNAADAHILAADRLAPGAVCAGKAYFISNGEPRPLWTIVNGILAAAGLPPATKRIPRLLANAAAIGLESSYRLLGIRSEPRMTRFLLSELTHAHWFDISAARRDLDYEPKITIDAGLRKLQAWFEQKRLGGEQYALTV